MADLVTVLGQAVEEALKDAQKWEDARKKDPGDPGALMSSVIATGRVAGLMWVIERMVAGGVLTKAVGDVLIWNLTGPTRQIQEAAAAKQD